MTLFSTWIVSVRSSCSWPTKLVSLVAGLSHENRAESKCGGGSGESPFSQITQSFNYHTIESLGAKHEHVSVMYGSWRNCNSRSAEPGSRHVIWNVEKLQLLSCYSMTLKEWNNFISRLFLFICLNGEELGKEVLFVHYVRKLGRSLCCLWLELQKSLGMRLGRMLWIHSLEFWSWKNWSGAQTFCSMLHIKKHLLIYICCSTM